MSAFVSNRSRIMMKPNRGACNENSHKVHVFNSAKKQRLNNGSSVNTGFNNNNNNSSGNHGFRCNGGAGTGDAELQKQRKSLPIYPVRFKLVQEIRKYNSVIVIGETGSGKTTQIPQFLLDAGLQRFGMIGITQPRRVAAVTIATRVAEEMNATLGQQVGYCVRFEDVTSQATKIKFLTDGMMLREAMLDSSLKRYSVVVLDEAHERTLHTDVLFGVVKAAQHERSKRNFLPLKIVVMSATMDVDHFSNYFNKAPVLYLEGRQFPVQVMYMKETPDDYIFSTLVTVFQIHKTAPAQEDILVFLTGQEEIENLAKSIRVIAKSLPDCPTVRVCPMYAALPTHVQLSAFHPTAQGCRKIVLSTNIAETSVTISGIKYVIDSGMVKSRLYLPNSGLELLKVQRISKAQAWQRSGRAGRESSGVCYRTYSESDFQKLDDFTKPEIQRCNLAGITLELLTIGVKDLLTFDFMDKPTTENIASAIDQLQLLGAVEKKEHYQLTPLGRQMACFPLDPRFAKVLLASRDLKCTDEILSIIALMSVENVLIIPHAMKEEALTNREKFVSSEGDHVTMLNVFKAYRSANGAKQWCHANFVHQRNMQMASDIRKQLVELCTKAGLHCRSTGLNTSNVRKCLTAGLFMNAAELQRDGVYLTLDTKQAVSIHPSSVLFRCKPACVIFDSLVQTSKCYIRNLSIVDPEWLLEKSLCPNKKSTTKT